MRLVAWIIRIVLFALLFVLALRNTDDATLQLFFGAVWHAPLILILLAAFGLGIVAGLAAVAPGLMRQRMEVARLRRALNEARRASGHPPGPGGTPPPEAMSGVPAQVPAKTPYNVIGPSGPRV